MKIIIGISILLISINIVTSQKSDLAFGNICEENQECKSQHCISICDHEQKQKACTEPNWYYLRHGKEIPTCMHPSYVRRNVGSIPFTRVRMIGHSCHSDKNCQSKHCLPMCESSTTMWRCVEPKSFFERQKLDMPKCVKLSYIVSYRQEQKLKGKEIEQVSSVNTDSEGPRSIEDEEKAVTITPGPSRMLGQTCAQHAECFSSNCVSVCETSENKESRCIEPRLSFTMHKLPVPNCIGLEAANDLVKLVLSSVNADENSIEEVIWKRLNFLSHTPDDKLKNRSKNSSSSKSAKANANDKPKSAPILEASQNGKSGSNNWSDLYSSLRSGVKSSG